jgi:selenophosphate synthetase-related protein
MLTLDLRQRGSLKEAARMLRTPLVGGTQHSQLIQPHSSHAMGTIYSRSLTAIPI